MVCTGSIVIPQGIGRRAGSKSNGIRSYASGLNALLQQASKLMHIHDKSPHLLCICWHTASPGIAPRSRGSIYRCDRFTWPKNRLLVEVPRRLVHKRPFMTGLSSRLTATGPTLEFQADFDSESRSSDFAHIEIASSESGKCPSHSSQSQKVTKKKERMHHMPHSSPSQESKKTETA